ncbi:MAG: FixH family protein [Halieaceae bacterium]|nr:FixH family protein [Halieaceae bacterium]
MLPWYRQFWPWFLILLPGTAVVASLYTLIIANQYADDLVVDDYYKEGLAINRQLKRQNEARVLELKATFTSQQRQLDIQLEGPIEASQLRLLLSHAIESDQDFAVPVQQIGRGHYRVLLPQVLKGRWHWTLDEGVSSHWRLDGDHFF